MLTAYKALKFFSCDIRRFHFSGCHSEWRHKRKTGGSRFLATLGMTTRKAKTKALLSDQDTSRSKNEPDVYGYCRTTRRHCAPALSRTGPLLLGGSQIVSPEARVRSLPEVCTCVVPMETSRERSLEAGIVHGAVAGHWVRSIFSAAS